MLEVVRDDVDELAREVAGEPGDSATLSSRIGSARVLEGVLVGSSRAFAAKMPMSAHAMNWTGFQPAKAKKAPTATKRKKDGATGKLS